MITPLREPWPGQEGDAHGEPVPAEMTSFSPPISSALHRSLDALQAGYLFVGMGSSVVGMRCEPVNRPHFTGLAQGGFVGSFLLEIMNPSLNLRKVSPKCFPGPAANLDITKEIVTKSFTSPPEKLTRPGKT